MQQGKTVKMVGLPDTTEERRKPQHALMCIYILLLSNLAALNVYFSFNKKKKKRAYTALAALPFLKSCVSAGELCQICCKGGGRR